ncbi:MAG: hypothetical protein ABIK79_00660, partial [Chloroflexota bacterium]
TQLFLSGCFHGWKQDPRRFQMENWFAQYVDPHLDGSRLPVTGMGQLAPVSHGAKGALAFNQCLVLKDGTVTNKKMIDLWPCLENSTWFP